MLQLLSWRNSPNNIAICLYILPVYEPCCLLTSKDHNYNNHIFLKSDCDEYPNKDSNQLNSLDLHSIKDTLSTTYEPEQDPYDEDFVQKTINSNNLITVKPKYQFNQEQKLYLIDLKVTPVSHVYNLLKDRETILKEYKNKGGIYIIHNNVNGKQYVGSGKDLSKRLATYSFPSRLVDSRYIYNSILKYGHGNFSIVILYVLGNTGTFTKKNIVHKEQQYINLCKPILNLNPRAGSSMGFKHSEESKRLISEFRKGKPLPEHTKKRLSVLFSGELNPF
uniref:GIY-YIG endonuclease n=1 Tax=Hirsutella rhossiliensis TaxID=111463 RepID=A0A3G4R782_9HYPO|nr:GIY-YIG endonuclease [Hirsutella rhossiliensis]